MSSSHFLETKNFVINNAVCHFSARMKFITRGAISKGNLFVMELFDRYKE